MTTATEILQQRLPGARPRIGMILGSGWSSVIDAIENPQRVAYADLPGFPQPRVAGHVSDVVVGRLGRHEVAVMGGRKHTYETGRADAMKIPIRALREWGCDVLVQTNAAGSVDANIPPGSLMAISDHINFSQHSPLIGEMGNERFVSMTNAYDIGLRQQAHEHAGSMGVDLFEGVYAWFVGPQFETPAEIRMAMGAGANAVGMSTVPETILARHAGMQVLAFSLITNMGAGLSSETLSHAHTLSQAQASAKRATSFLARVVGQLAI